MLLTTICSIKIFYRKCNLYVLRTRLIAMTRNNSKDKNSNFVQRFEEIADLENNIDTCRRKIIDNKIFPVNIKHFNIVST